MKLIGEDNISQPHVLNYPDPQSLILQRFGKDLFILKTQHHLRNITNNELWFDCVGQNPSWFCRDITVLDLQKHTEWYFHVRKKVSLIRGSTDLELKPTHGNKQESKVFSAAKCRFILSPKHHNWYLWEHEPTFSYLKKLTVILSNLLTNYALVLIFIGLPRFEMRDGLDERRHYRVNVFDIYVALLSSFVTFMVHIPVAWFFRFSPIQFSHYEQDVKLTFRYTQACWYILISMITVSTAFLTMSRFWVPHIKSLVWLTICAISVTFGVIVYESIFVCIAKFFYRFHIVEYNVRQKFADIRTVIEGQRRYLFSRFGEQLLRPYFENFYRPLRKRQIKSKTMTILH
ncbi:hypothetical protein Zmor_026163 [Zophobas morio]|uniref:PLAT domain-containing protein n=1 Tax=Zophobas morio TaxID=2755281 RepID=A0AA38HT11_9CUCU|nr:hypothetical protein Zmor_026163 [Zophobas morio]